MKEIGNFFDRYDLFAEEIPKFHLDGQNKIGTSVGCCLSVLLVTMIAAYSGIRGHMVLTGDRPTISSFTVQDERDGAELVDLNAHQFKVAFSVQHPESSHKLSPRDDPNFVEWHAFFEHHEKETVEFQIVNVHKCTEEDYSEFHKIVEHQNKTLETKKKKNMFYCLDKTDQFGRPVNMTMYGDWNSGFTR